MSLEAQLILIAQEFGADIAAAAAARGNLASLPTTNKTNLASAIAEVYGIAVAAGGGGAAIDDEAGTGDTAVTLSANEIGVRILALKNELLGPEANAALDTFREIADQIATDQSAVAALATAVNKRIRFDAAQTLTGPEQAQARANMGAASAADLAAFVTAVGDTEVDLVAIYNAAKA